MSRQIIRQPDGLYCVFSSNVDAFVATDATAEELIRWFVLEAAADASARTERLLEQVDAGTAYPRPFAVTYAEAFEADRRYAASGELDDGDAPESQTL